MAATYRTSVAGGTSSGTGNRTATITPAVGDLLIVYCFVAANTNDTPTCSDSNGSGTYDRIDVMNASIASINYRLSVFIRTALMANTTSTVITVATGSNTSGCVVSVAISGMSRVGADAVRSKGSQNNQAAGTAAPVLNQSALTGNLTIVAHGSADTTTTEPTGWTERQDTSQSNDTVALEVATRNSGFTGTTITFGAASSTVFCSHALELDGSALLTGSALVDGVGAVASAATFFSVFSRTSLNDAAGLIATAGQRSLLRSSAIDAASIINSSSVFFSVLSGSALVNTSSDISATGELLSVVSGSSAIDGTVSVTVSGEFFSIFGGSALLDTEVGIQTAATFFSIFQGAGTVNVDAAIESNGEIEAPTGAHERSASLTTNGEVHVNGLAVLERAAEVDGAGLVSVSAESLSVFQSVSDFSASSEIQSAGQRVVLRSGVLDTVGDITVSGSFFSVLQSSGLITGLVGIQSDGLIGLVEHEGSVSINVSSVILVSGISVHIVHFAPRQSIVIGSTSRSLSVGTEARTQTTESEAQTGTI